MNIVDMSMAEAEVTVRRIMVPAGTVVSIGNGWYTEVTQESMNCDCGKAILCPQNVQFKINPFTGNRIYPQAWEAWKDSSINA